MKRIGSLMLVMLLISGLCFCADIMNKSASKSKNALSDYEEYISDRNKGKYVDFCGMISALKKSEKARCYYKSNSRKKNGFLITDYCGGICINKVLNPKNWDYKIPEKIDGKPVLKLGCYLSTKNKVKPFIEFASEGAKEISLPKTLHYIDYPNLYNSYNRIYYKVSKCNPYYATDRIYQYLFALKDGYVYSTKYIDIDMREIEKVKKSSLVDIGKADKPYKKLKGYREYVSDCNKGAVSSFCGMNSSMDQHDAKKRSLAREYYKKNARVVDGFRITDYLDGICINEVINKKEKIIIPETIEGKSVIKIGSYLYYDKDLESECCCSFLMNREDEFHGGNAFLPKTIKYIEIDTLIHSRWAQFFYSVDKENPYYATSKKGELYDYDFLLYAIEDGFVQPAFFEDNEF